MDLTASAPLLIWGIFAHRVADWLLQNHWMATKKGSPAHPAAWVHAGIHFIASFLVFGLHGAAIIALLHLLIDTRKPLDWWGKLIRQSDEGEVGLHVKFNRDQVAHEVVIAIVAVMKAAGRLT